MKKSFYLLIATLLLLISCELKEEKDDTSPVTPGEVTLDITSPTDGDSLTVAGSYEIKWESNSSQKLIIDYTKDNGANWVSVARNIENDGSYIWSPIPNAVSEQCRIRLMTADSATTALSDGFFKIVSSGVKSIKVNSPNGGELLLVGESFDIKWLAIGVQNVKIDFSIDSGANWNTIVESYPADSAKYRWSPIPNFLSQSCLIKISDVENDKLSDVSDLVFKISTPKEIVVTSPNGGEIWMGNSAQVITWSSSNVANVSIHYTIDNGITWKEIVASTPSDGYYSWDPVENTPSNNAKIMIINADGGFPSDQSDEVFSIAPEQAIQILSPAGGEQWKAGSNQYIRWTALTDNSPAKQGIPVSVQSKKANDREMVSKGSKRKLSKVNRIGNVDSPEKVTGGSIEKVKIEYSVNSGAEWFTITDSVDNSGAYLWENIPSHNSSLCLIRISDADDGLPMVVTNRPFSIFTELPEELTIVTPNGDEKWIYNQMHVIEWTSAGVEKVTLQYSLDNGQSWENIVEGYKSYGAYQWDPPNVVSSQARIRIIDVSAAAGTPPLSDISDNKFSITSPSTETPPEILVTSPNGGEKYTSGENVDITWASKEVAKIEIEYSINGGSSWQSIVSDYDNVGVYTWGPIPSINSRNCLIRISDMKEEGVFDQSDNSFEISNQITETIAVISPNGGEEWRAGTVQNIKWQANALQAVNLDYSTNGGTTWELLAKDVPNTGAYEWSLDQSLNSTRAKVRISDATDGDPVDVSDGAFTIAPIESLKVTSPSAGQIIRAGDPVIITWESSGIENVGIQYTTTNGLGSLDEPQFYIITPSTPNKGSFETTFSIPSDKYYIVVFNANDTRAPQARSSGNFTVLPQESKSISLLEPNGSNNPGDGENWLVGETYEIRWISKKVERVNIEYTLDGGANWDPIAMDITNHPPYNWKVDAPVGTRSENCKIRVSDVEEEEVMDESDGYFTILTAFLRVDFPNGGEYIAQCDDESTDTDTLITWKSAGVERVNIYYTVTNLADGVWIPVVSDYPSTGAYNLDYSTIPYSALGRIKIEDASNTDLSDESDSYVFFNICAGMKLLYPDPEGERISNSKEVEFVWEADPAIGKVALEYSTDSGKSWKKITNVSVNRNGKMNKFRWNNNELQGDKVRFRVRGKNTIDETKDLKIMK